MRKWIGLVLGLVLLTGCSRPVLQRQTFTVELGQDVYANAALYIKDAENYETDQMEVEALSPGVVKKENRFISKNLDYLVVGEYDFTIHTGQEDLDFKIAIKDTQPPTIDSYQKEITISRGEVIDWSRYFEASDLNGVSFSVESDLDTSQAGEKEVTVRIQDRFGNAVERSVKVIVQ